MKIHHASKTIALSDGTYLHFWYANNAGRGGNNCTIVRSSNPDRAVVSAKQSDVISATYTSAWAGKVNFSRGVQRRLGIDETIQEVKP